LALPLSGCKQQATTPTAAPAGDLKTFSIHGKIISVDPVKGSVLLDHEAVPGFMEAMTMTYPLKDKSVVSELHPGDRIAAKLLVRKTPGDAVPDFKLVNQSGKTIHLAQFKGRVLLLTFIYTRCPLADFCPRMSRNFAEIDQHLQADPKLLAQTHLLSISFDPRYDTPAVLRSYGGSYTGRFTKETFDHWDFAAPPESELPALTEFFNVGITPGEGSDAGAALTHSLSTVLIGKDGKIAAWYPSNEWTPTEALAAIKTAAGA
jgi:protein SCO1/2